MRVSAVLPKWMVGKFIGRDFAGLRKKIHYTYANFEVKWSFCRATFKITQTTRLSDGHQTTRDGTQSRVEYCGAERSIATSRKPN